MMGHPNPPPAFWVTSFEGAPIPPAAVTARTFQKYAADASTHEPLAPVVIERVGAVTATNWIPPAAPPFSPTGTGNDRPEPSARSEETCFDPEPLITVAVARLSRKI